jgi:ribosomal protein S5
MGKGNASEVPEAIRKAVEQAKKSLIRFRRARGVNLFDELRPDLWLPQRTSPSISGNRLDASTPWGL